MKPRALTAAEWKKIHDANKRSESDPDPAQENWLDLTTDTAKDTAKMNPTSLTDSRGGT